MVDISVIVFSYNRPRMLGEALRSIVGADEVLVADDGSSFDVDRVVSSSGLSCRSVRIMAAGPMTTEKRLVTARLGKNANSAIRAASGDVITYLCDDDLFHPGWIQTIKDVWSGRPDLHWAKGKWGLFKDGEIPHPIEECLCPLHAAHLMTTGNFAHLKSCVASCNMWWSEKSVAVHDNYLINAALPRAHPYASVPDIGLAGWRREHDYNMLKYVRGENYAENAPAVLKRGFLE